MLTYKNSFSRFTAFGFSGFCHFTKFRVRVVPIKGPVHTYRLFENSDFFSPVWPSGENGHLKRIFSKTLPRNAGFSFIYGRSKREVFEDDDVINHMLLALRMLCEGCCRISIVLAFSYLSTRRSWLHVRQPEVFLQHDSHRKCQDVLGCGQGLQNASSQVETRGSSSGFLEEYSLYKSRNSSSEIMFPS